MVLSEKAIQKLYYSISEVSNITDLKQYVLRYWETEFPMLKPKKNRAGNRIYRQSDIDMVLRIKDLLYNQKYTIEGARQQLKRGEEPSIQGEVSQEYLSRLKTLFQTIRQELQGVLEILYHE